MSPPPALNLQRFKSIVPRMEKGLESKQAANRGGGQEEGPAIRRLRCYIDSRLRLQLLIDSDRAFHRLLLFSPARLPLTIKEGNGGGGGGGGVMPGQHPAINAVFYPRVVNVIDSVLKVMQQLLDRKTGLETRRRKPAGERGDGHSREFCVYLNHRVLILKDVPVHGDKTQHEVEDGSKPRGGDVGI
ncbi:unnamed protein product [Pleuronectes platessa]|uniref:Uncharacterized protein n=1 Tax=Pleuronectes platessa TaxID=8262 RepID=A0A9N7VB97_PLEPL|nr:unnamed protein product [Pleuronectes platessa]